METLKEVHTNISENKAETNLGEEIAEESLERIKENLEIKQRESEDEFFKKLDLGQLKPEALVILNATMEEFETPFPKDIKKKAVSMASESPLYPDDFSGPSERLAYIKDLIVRYPNAFYTKEKEL
ncbi:MAG: hypothetical protein GXP44_01060 [bacterium]|nr:hypothetical protein [bacterium]